MNKSKLIIIGSIIVIAGVGGYFGYQWYKKNKAKKDSENKDSGSSAETPSTSSTSSSTESTSQYSFPSSWTTKEGDAFRQWVRANYPDYAKQIDLDASGSLNAYVDKAYQKYGTQYQNSLKGSTSVAPSKDVRFKLGERVKTNKSVVVTPYRVLNNKLVATGEPNKTLDSGTNLYIASNAQMLDGKVTYNVNPTTWTGGQDKDIYYSIYQQHLQLS